MRKAEESVPILRGWSQVPDGLRTETQWREEGRRLRRGVQPSAQAYSRWRHQYYPLYTVGDTEPKRQQRAGQALDLSAYAIGAAIYEINKAAKRRRDAAQSTYRQRRHGFAGMHRRAKERLYELKAKAIRKAAHEGLARLVGYHAKQDERSHFRWRDDEDPQEDRSDEECDEIEKGRWEKTTEKVTTTMECYELAGFRFHLIVDTMSSEPDVEIKDLGGWLSHATARTKHMPLKDAEATLQKYLATGC